VVESRWMFKCLECQTIMAIITTLDEDKIHKAPPCPCGKARMVNMASQEYADSKIKP
jgi:hypothetical protein